MMYAVYPEDSSLKSKEFTTLEEAREYARQLKEDFGVSSRIDIESITLD